MIKNTNLGKASLINFDRARRKISESQKNDLSDDEFLELIISEQSLRLIVAAEELPVVELSELRDYEHRVHAVWAELFTGYFFMEDSEQGLCYLNSLLRGTQHKGLSDFIGFNIPAIVNFDEWRKHRLSEDLKYLNISSWDDDRNIELESLADNPILQMMADVKVIDPDIHIMDHWNNAVNDCKPYNPSGRYKPTIKHFYLFERDVDVFTGKEPDKKKVASHQRADQPAHIKGGEAYKDKYAPVKKLVHSPY